MTSHHGNQLDVHRRRRGASLIVFKNCMSITCSSLDPSLAGAIVGFGVDTQTIFLGLENQELSVLFVLKHLVPLAH